MDYAGKEGGVDRGMGMTYIDYLNRFNQWLESNALPASSQLMYFKLLNVFNRAGWPETVQVDNLRMMLMLDGASKTTVIRARDKLVRAGFITYQRGGKGKPNVYRLARLWSKNCTINDTTNDTINATENATENDTINATHIKTKNKTKNKKDIPPPPLEDGGGGPMDYEAYRQAFVEECPSLPQPGPASGWSENRKKTLRARQVSPEEFRAVCQRVQRSDFLTGRRTNWRGCSLDWIIKAANWQKIVEGNYDNREEAGYHPDYSGTEEFL